MAQVYSKQKNYESSLNELYKIWEQYEAAYGKDSIQCANAFLEIAKVHIKKKEFDKGIDIQQKAFDILKNLSDQDQDFVAGVAETLSEW